MEPFIAAYRDVLTNYAKFDGRLSVGGFWRFVAVNVVISAALNVLAQASDLLGLVAVVYGLALLVPSIAAGIRRLHDTGKSGWYLLVALIPIVGLVLLIVWTIPPGDPGTNAYGPPPTTPATAAMAPPPPPPPPPPPSA